MKKATVDGGVHLACSQTAREAPAKQAELEAERIQLRHLAIALSAAELNRESICRLGLALPVLLREHSKPPARLGRALGVSTGLANKAREIFRESTQSATAQEEAAALLGARITTVVDQDYPEALRDLELPPPALYHLGDIPDGAAVALVGPRNADPYGLEAAKWISKGLAEAGVTIVSGFARGVDAAAHRAAIDATNGKTVAVLGCGLGVPYPSSHFELAHRIAERGAVISEFPCGVGPRAEHFPIRNRLIAALSLATVVAQATRRSGSLITARLALDLGREVFAVPGRVFDRRSAGTNELLRDGAHIALGAESVLEALPLSAKLALARPPDAPRLPLSPLLAALEAESTTAEALVLRAGLSLPEVLSGLMELELEGRVTRHQGGLFSLVRG